MKIKITYHTDEGRRKGCHPVSMLFNGDKAKRYQHDDTIFLIDEPGAWWDDEWNCHVDGTDYPFKTREECIVYGLRVLGYLTIEETE